MAYAASEKTVFRGGVGKFYEPARNQFMYQVLSSAVIGSAYTFDTGTDRSATRGQRPAHPCLNPVGDGAGRAEISPACRAMLVDLRNRNAAGSVFLDIPLLRGTPRLGYLWSWSVGVEREVVPNVAVTVDYVGNVGHDQTGTDRHQRRAARRRRGGDPPGHRRVRSDGHADSGGGARRELPARPGVSDAGRLQHRLPGAGAGGGEADVQPLVRARELLASHARAMSMSSPGMPMPSGTGGSTTITA